ncbi:MAG TPA: T9SS type A sorting domain-containing protein, partial [Phnomibacter sp.]|nr:T9SS type A sorting domain-containing protein [Phnomibacter sp.]
YVNANCPPDPTDPLGNIEIVVCPEQGSGSTLVYPVSEVAEYFPPGTRFYNQVALPRIEFTDPGNPFPVPAVGATVTYYALPPGLAASCFIPFKIIGCDRQVFVSATPTCDKDVPYLDYVITGNYTFAPGTLAQIEWIPGPNPESGITPDPAYPTPIAVMPLTDQPLTGRLMWPGAVKDGSNVGVDWPGWVLEAGNWVFKEDGYSWYKQGGSIKVTVISPAAEVLTATQPVTYPAITLSGCNPGPPLSITGKVYKDANGMSDNEVNGIGTNAGGLFVAVVRGGVVVGSTAVDMNGDFTVSKPQGVLPNASHELILVTAAPSVGSSLSTASFPAGWSSTGEYLGAGTGSDGTPNSKLTVPVTTTSVINAKFGLCDGFANVSGTIRDADEDTLILGAMIALIPQATGLTPMQVMATGADGAFAFNNIIPGSYLVQVLDASLNARGLYPFGSTSSLAFRNLIGCQPSTVEFFYGKSPLPVLGDFVWLDVNGNDVQDEWFDANNDGFITENPNNAPFDLADWEWVDLNHNGTYDQPEDEGELNKCGFGNTNSAGFPPGQVGNIYVTQLSGDHAFTPRYQIIGVTGYWRVRPTDAGTGLLPNHGNYRAQMVVTEDLRTNGQALAQTGKCKVATGVPTNLAQPKQENEPETETSSEGLGPGDLVMVMSGPGFVDGVVTTTDPADLTMDMGVSMQVQAPSIVVTKVPSQTTYSAAGDQIQYTITVTNNGNVPIINVTVADATADGQPLYVSGDGNGNSTLDLGEAWVYTATRTITPADVTATSYTNTAIATGESTAGDPVEDDAQASVVLRNISVVATPVCIQDVPYLNFTITSNFDMTGLTADVRWLTGTPQSLPPTSPVSPIVPQVDINGVTLNVAPGGFSATGQVIWPGAVADGGGNGVDWPGWVYEDNDWFNLEDGYSGYRTNPTFRITVNPTTETTGFVYPPSSPLCLTEPPITVNGTVWRDADGCGKLNPNNIQTGTEVGTDGTPNPGSDQLYANAVARGKNGNPTVVIDVTTVNPNGTYTFEHIQRQYLTDDYDFEVVLSTVQGTVGSNTIPGEGAPTQWETTVGSKLIPSSVANVFELDLGAQQLPDTEDKVENITGALGVGQIYLLDDQHLEGSDAEDGAKGAGNPFRITSLPAYANLYYNGVQITQADVTAGTGTAIISNYNPALLDIRFTAALDVNNLPITQTSFTYAAIDLANGVDPTPATYLINISSILPATGLSLSGKLTGNEVRLVWTTVTEANTSHFVVERSADGSRFSSLGNVTAAGSSQTMRSYNYEDNKLQSSQIWYYRIKLVDMDGTVRYSNVVSIRLAAITGILQVYPNPVDNRFYVTLPDNGRYKMELVNAQGQQVWTKQVTINNPLTAETIERNGMANGVYMLRVTRADGQWQQSVKIWLK